MSGILIEDDFRIFVGRERGTDALLGYLEKGNSIIKGKAEKAQPIGGMAMFPNYFQAWGRRVINGEIPKSCKDGRVPITHPEYTGQVEWLKNDDPKGYVIWVRYMVGQATLDYQYQITSLGLPKINEVEENDYLTLPFGETTVFYSKDPAWATLLQIHYMNDDSLAKMPGAEGSMFKIIKEYNSSEQQVKLIDAEFEALKVVKSATNFDDLLVIKNIMSRKTEITYKESDETTLYDALAIYAKTKPNDFLECIQEYDKSSSEILSLCESFEAIDNNTKGFVVLLKPKKEVLITNENVKKGKVYEWMYDHRYEKEVSEALDKINIISQQFK